jgi:hypothetical protein
MEIARRAIDAAIGKGKDIRHDNKG